MSKSPENKRCGRLGIAGIALSISALLAGCGDVVVGTQSSKSSAIAPCGANEATNSSGISISKNEYSGLLQKAKADVALLYQRTSANMGRIDLSNGNDNGNALESTPNNLSISYKYVSDTVVTENNGYAINVAFSGANHPELGLGILACNTGADVYETVFARQIGSDVAETVNFPSA